MQLCESLFNKCNSFLFSSFQGFKPSSGTVTELTFRSMKNVWGYFSVGADGGLHEFADSQFGHCFAWGENRDAARRCENLVKKLKLDHCLQKVPWTNS